MRINPAAFIHLSVRDQWKLAFGEKMHGRDKEQRVLLDVASHVTGFVSNDAVFEALTWCIPRNKQHIPLITGQPGSVSISRYIALIFPVPSNSCFDLYIRVKAV